MATKRPLAPDASGAARPITAPDTIDPSILPSSSSATPTRIASGTTFNVGDNTEQFKSRRRMDNRGRLATGANARLLET